MGGIKFGDDEKKTTLIVLTGLIDIHILLNEGNGHAKYQLTLPRSMKYKSSQTRVQLSIMMIVSEEQPCNRYFVKRNNYRSKRKYFASLSLKCIQMCHFPNDDVF